MAAHGDQGTVGGVEDTHVETRKGRFTKAATIDEVAERLDGIAQNVAEIEGENTFSMNPTLCYSVDISQLFIVYES